MLYNLAHSREIKVIAYFNHTPKPSFLLENKHAFNENYQKWSKRPNGKFLIRYTKQCIVRNLNDFSQDTQIKACVPHCVVKIFCFVGSLRWKFHALVPD